MELPPCVKSLHGRCHLDFATITEQNFLRVSPGAAKDSNTMSWTFHSANSSTSSLRPNN